jgi:hypothetical protein
MLKLLNNSIFLALNSQVFNLVEFMNQIEFPVFDEEMLKSKNIKHDKYF